MNVRDNIKAGKYINHLPYKGGDNQIRQAYRDENYRLEQIFKQDLEEEFDVQNNPKKDLLFSKAWEQGHAYGFNEVYNHYIDLVDLIM
ncbi:hypothetical protein [Caulobacter phage Cr30]|uniref:hypothetical protein n=1 Tax=Caulobacter phage Cr30 TaxID=1357714 RepID=UPI0004A9BAC6|nr:hypothetical protein OZ74_gp054 [Caulobacter phage Cr30]AGS80939.1 hypothetical protein [Caulobacter phage Cr30]